MTETSQLAADALIASRDTQSISTQALATPRSMFLYAKSYEAEMQTRCFVSCMNDEKVFSVFGEYQS